MRLVGIVLLSVAVVSAQSRLNLVIVEGEGAINNVRQRVTREPVVQVEDENHKPVAGALVVFSLPSNGAGGTFPNGGSTLTAVTDNQGRATMRGFRPNNAQGSYQIRVTASLNGVTASNVINQSNGAGAGSGAAASAGISGKLIAVLVAAGAAAAAGGAVLATRGGSSSTPAPSATTITPGTGSVGPPN